MMTVILDSGAFIAAEKFSRKLTNILDASRELGSTVLVPSAVIAEMWKDPPRLQSVKLLKGAGAVPPLDDRIARKIGALLSKSSSIQIVDANVALLAIAHAPSLVVTSDPGDIASLIASAGSAAVLSTSPKARTAPVVIEPI